MYISISAIKHFLKLCSHFKGACILALPQTLQGLTQSVQRH